VLRTPRVLQAEQYDCAQHLADLEAEFGADLLLRSAVWLTAAMEQHCGRYDGPLSDTALGDLQAQILGPRATRHGLRRSPVFVGEVDGFTEVVHYIAPHWNDVPALLVGLREFAVRTAGASALARAAVLSFGFLYIHPMSDGNGRISRFLVNDVLRRDGAVPAPFILPVSATITSTVIHRRGYDQVLELFSRPLMRKYAQAWRFGAEQVAEDGVQFNLQFDAWHDALPAWRYPDMTDHVEYLAQVVQLTIEQEMRKEAGHLRSLRTARERVKQVIEGPDGDIDRIIRSVREGGGQVSHKLVKEFPALADEGLAAEVVAAVQGAFVGQSGRGAED
jgi:hypothetical protein